MSASVAKFLVGEVSLQKLCHAEGLDLLGSEDGLHLLIRGEPLLVGRVLQVLFLEVGPEPLNDLAPRQLLVLLGVHDGGQLLGQGHRLGQAIELLWLGVILSTGHFVILGSCGCVNRSKALHELRVDVVRATYIRLGYGHRYVLDQR